MRSFMSSLSCMQGKDMFPLLPEPLSCLCPLGQKADTCLLSNLRIQNVIPHKLWNNGSPSRRECKSDEDLTPCSIDHPAFSFKGSIIIIPSSCSFRPTF